jgi:orotate phosphoribosyltransferase
MLVDLLKKTGAIKFGDFMLSSGKKSNIYIDIKIACTSPEVLKTISEEIVRKIDEINNSESNFDKIACVELGGVPLAVSLSLFTGKPYVIFRKAKKDYGVKGDLIGDIGDGERIVVVEDVTTTGSSALSVVERVEKYGGEVFALITIVDRGEGAKEVFSKRDITFIPLLTKNELLEGDV